MTLAVLLAVLPQPEDQPRQQESLCRREEGVEITPAFMKGNKYTEHHFLRPSHKLQ